MDHITLNNGVTIPQVGLGTYQLEPDDAQSAVTYALDNGYTLIDTANVYVNERAVGRGMRASSKARERFSLKRSSGRRSSNVPPPSTRRLSAWARTTST